MSGDSSSERFTKPLLFLSDLTNLSRKRAFSMDSGDLLSKSVDCHFKNVVDDDNEKVLNFTKRGYLDVDNWRTDGSESRPMLSKCKQSCSLTVIENSKIYGSLDAPIEVCDANVGPSRADVTMKSVVEVSGASRDSGELSDASICRDVCKIIATADLTTLGEGKTVDLSKLTESGSSMERSTAIKGESCSDTSAEFELIKACRCSFCLKASYILSDLHYQDIKGRIAALKKSQKEANILVQKCRPDSNKSSRLEFDLMDQWRSLFGHMESKFFIESNLLEESCASLTELRENCKTNLEMINMPPSDKK